MSRRANRTSAALNRSSPEPLHRQLATLLESAIRSGVLKPGDRLPSEAALTKRYGVSRITLRQAVGALVEKQILVRKQGKGTFVTRPTVQHDLRRLHGLLGSLFSQAEGATAQLLRYELRRPPADIADLFRLPDDAKALALARLYLIDGRPVAVTDTWLVPEIAAVPRVKAELISTEDMLAATGIRIASTRVAIRAVAAGARLGRLLKTSARTPLLEFDRKVFGSDGAAKQIGHIWLCSERYQLVSSTQSAGTMEGLFDLSNVQEGTS
jgi:GntR family transcriptional regulator